MPRAAADRRDSISAGRARRCRTGARASRCASRCRPACVRASAMPCPSAAACSISDESLKIGPREGSGQSRPTASNHGFHDSSSERSNVNRARSRGRAGSVGEPRTAHGEKRIAHQQLRLDVGPVARSHGESRRRRRHAGNRRAPCSSGRRVDVLVLRDEAAEPRQQPARRERRRDADAQLPRVAALARFAQCILDFGKRAAQPGREPLPFLRQPYAATCALDQAHVERRLQRLDLVTDRAVREVERFRSARQALPARRRLEGAQRLHRGNVRLASGRVVNM